MVFETADPFGVGGCNVPEFNDRREKPPVTFIDSYSGKPYTYSGKCSYCRAPHGQPCTTGKGKPTKKMHNGRGIEPA